MPKVSVIIPCFNQGEYLDEAVGSVLAQDYNDYEIVIVNDGSTDEFTNRLLADYEKPRSRVLHTENKGISGARNTGISASSGKYILPLDADDLIGKDYLRKAVDVLDDNHEIGIATCHIMFFGEKEFQPELRPFSIENMLLHNDLPCASLFRRNDWERVGGFNSAMTSGWEDWDFWLSLLELGAEVSRLPEVLFFYRIRSDSRERSMGKEERLRMFMRLYENHKGLYSRNMPVLFGEICDYHEFLSSRSYRYARFLDNPELLLQSLYRRINKNRAGRKEKKA